MNIRPMASDSVSTRRIFLASLAAAGVALPLTGLAAEKKKEKSAPAAAPAPSPAGPAVAHVFSKPMYQMSWADTAKMVAECGYGGIDYTVRKAQAHVLPAKVREDLPRAVEAAHAAGLKVEMITTDILSLQDEHAETVIRTAAQCGVKFYRMGFINYDAKLGVLGTLEKLQPQMKELAQFNASVGVHGAIQNHTGARVGGPLWDLYHLLRDIDPRGLGVQYDIRHATAEGAQSWPLALRILAPWIRCVDVKDFRWKQSPGKAVVEGMPLGDGIVPIEAFFREFQSLGIGGPMSVHFEYPPFEGGAELPAAEKPAAFRAALRKDMAVLRGHLAKIGRA